MDKRIKPMGTDPIYNDKVSSEEVLVGEAQKWIDDYQSRTIGTTFLWTKAKAREFKNTSIETLIRDPYFLGMGDTVYDGVLEDIVSLFSERKRRDIHLAIFQEGIGCLNPDKSWVWNENGLCKLKDINKDNNSILSKEGIQQVLGSKTELKKAFLLKTRTGLEFECGEDHPFLAMDKNGIPNFIKTKDIEVGVNYLAISLKDSQFGKTKIPLDLAWVLGVLIGDGCITKNICLTAHKTDIEILNKTKIILEKYFDCIGTIKLDERRKDNFRLGFSNVTEFRSFLVKEKIFGKNAFQKTFPKSILSGTKEVVTSFLSGYYDTDGSSNNKRGNVDITSVSKVLLQQTQFTLFNLGIISRLGIKKTSWNKGLKKSFTNRLKISGEEALKFYNIIEFSLKRKQKNKILLKVDSFNTNINLIPNQSNLLYNTWKNSSKTQKGFKTIINPNYHQSPSKHKLKRFYTKYSNSTADQELKLIKERIDEDIFWDEVISIEPIREIELKDLVVDVNNTYIANGSIHHNSGKTIKASILMWIAWFELCCLDVSPQVFYDLAPRSVIALMMFSRSERQSREVTFTEVWNRFQSPFNKDYFPPSERYSREIRINVNNTCVFAGTSSALSALGYNLYGGVIDEACMVFSTLKRVDFTNNDIDFNILTQDENHYQDRNVSVTSYIINKQQIKVVNSAGIKFAGYRQIYDIELEDGTVLGLTENQLILVNSDNGQVYKKVKELTIYDDILLVT